MTFKATKPEGEARSGASIEAARSASLAPIQSSSYLSWTRFGVVLNGGFAAWGSYLELAAMTPLSPPLAIAGAILGISGGFGVLFAGVAAPNSTIEGIKKASERATNSFALAGATIGAAIDGPETLELGSDVGSLFGFFYKFDIDKGSFAKEIVRAKETFDAGQTAEKLASRLYKYARGADSPTGNDVTLPHGQEVIYDNYHFDEEIRRPADDMEKRDYFAPITPSLDKSVDETA